MSDHLPLLSGAPAQQRQPEAATGTVEMVGAAPGGPGTPEAASSLREALNAGMLRQDSGALLQRATSTATSRARRHKRAKPLSLLPLVALCFYDVSGGPFGIEVRLRKQMCTEEPNLCVFVRHTCTAQALLALGITMLLCLEQIEPQMMLRHLIIHCKDTWHGPHVAISSGWKLHAALLL